MNVVGIKALMAMVVASAFACSVVNAGEFNVWSYSKNAGKSDVVISFAGDGVEQEAMADFLVPKGFSLLKAEVLVAGSICVGLDNNSYIRAVPPSGAGVALPAKETDYCRFTFASVGKSANAKLNLKEKFTECSSPGSEIKSCGLQSYDVSEAK